MEIWQTVRLALVRAKYADTAFVCICNSGHSINTILWENI